MAQRTRIFSSNLPLVINSVDKPNIHSNLQKIWYLENINFYMINEMLNLKLWVQGASIWGPSKPELILTKVITTYCTAYILQIVHIIYLYIYCIYLYNYRFWNNLSSFCFPLSIFLFTNILTLNIPKSANPANHS